MNASTVYITRSRSGSSDYNRIITRQGLLILDELEEPIANCEVECVLADGSTIQAVTDENGKVQVPRSQVTEIRIDNIHELA
jgi:uncharacterized protein (DUF2345 family)